jgi:hypothetical protein
LPSLSLSVCLHCLISPNRFACPSEANKDSLAGATTDRARALVCSSEAVHNPTPTPPTKSAGAGGDTGRCARCAGRPIHLLLLLRRAPRRPAGQKGAVRAGLRLPPIFASETIPSRARPRLLIANREATCGWMDEKSKSWRNRSVGRSVRLKN